MKTVFLFSLMFLVFLGPVSCSLWSQWDDTDESFWEDDNTTQESATKEIDDLKAKIQEAVKASQDSDAKITMMADEVDDVRSRIKEEKAAIHNLQSDLRHYQSGKKSPSTNTEELERRMKILKNDVEWLKWLEKNN